MYSLLINQKRSLLKNTVWYTIGSFFYSFSSIVLLIIVSRVLGERITGIFSIGWAIGQLVYTIGLFGTRNFQVADATKKYKLDSYLFFKLFTLVIMFLGTFVYAMFLGLSTEKRIVSLLITLLMSGEVVADVFSGFFQQENMLFISGQSYTFRVLGYDLIFTLSLLFSKNLISSLIYMCLFSFIWLFFFDFQIVKRIHNFNLKFDFNVQKSLFLSCFPIFLSAFFTNYIVNTPKNSIELYLTENIQAIYNVISMPSAIINLMASFILVPAYTIISTAWKEEDFERFFSIVKKMVVLIFLLTLLVVIVGGTIGLKILTIVFGIDLMNYNLEFVLLLLAGGLNSLITFFVFLLTVINMQKVLLYVYSSVAVLATIYTSYLVNHHALLGGSFSYLFSILLIAIQLVIVLMINLRRVNKT